MITEDMRFLTRQQFADHYNSLQPGLGDPNSPLWIGDPRGDQCRFFVRLTQPILNPNSHNDWCESHLDGLVRCFSSSETEEWWGFTNKDDIVLWILKWG